MKRKNSSTSIHSPSGHFRKAPVITLRLVTTELKVVRALPCCPLIASMRRNSSKPVYSAHRFQMTLIVSWGGAASALSPALVSFRRVEVAAGEHCFNRLCAVLAGQSGRVTDSQLSLTRQQQYQL